MMTYAYFCEFFYGFEDCNTVIWVGYFGRDTGREASQASADDDEMY